MEQKLPPIIANIRESGEKAAKKIEGMQTGKKGKTKRLYERAAELVREATSAIGMPDPYTDALTTDWKSAWEKQRKTLASRDFSALSEKNETDLKNLISKSRVYGSLLRKGYNLIEDIQTEGLIGKESEEIDYDLLSAMEPIKETGAALWQSVTLMNQVIRDRGTTYMSLSPKLGKKAKRAGKTLGDSSSTFSLCAATAAGASEIAKKQGMKRKIAVKEGEALLEMALDNIMLNQISTDVEKIVKEKKMKLGGCEYVEVQVVRNYGKGAYAVDGHVQGSGEGIDIRFRVKVIATDEGISARGDFASEISPRDFIVGGKGYAKIADAIDSAFERARTNAQEKAKTKAELATSQAGKELAESIDEDYRMAPKSPLRKVFEPNYVKHPKAVDIQSMIERVGKISKDVKDRSHDVKKNVVYEYSLDRARIFISSDGTSITDKDVFGEGGYFVSAKKPGKMAHFRYESLGGEGGLEVLDEGKNGLGKDLHDFVIEGTKDTIAVSAAEPMPQALADGSGTLNFEEGPDGNLYSDGTIKPTGKNKGEKLKQKVVLTSAAGILVEHELLGHASELDRAWGDANRWAGRTWYGNVFKTMIGKRVAPPSITLYIDSTQPDIGHYHTDDQGRLAKKKKIIDKGILVGFLNDGETAAYFNDDPSACSIATEATKTPLVRMPNLYIENGDMSFDEMVKTMGNGWIVNNIQTPAITGGRGNGHFVATSMTPVINGKTVYDKRTGKPMIYRGGAIMMDSVEDVWGVGNDAKSHTVNNCGKSKNSRGMQAKRVGHSQPSLGTEVYIFAGVDSGSHLYGAGIEGLVKNYMASAMRGGA